MTVRVVVVMLPVFLPLDILLVMRLAIMICMVVVFVKIRIRRAAAALQDRCPVRPYKQDPAYVGDLAMGGFKVEVPSRGRMVLARQLCRKTICYNIYYEIFGISREPDHAKISEDFTDIVKTAVVRN